MFSERIDSLSGFEYIAAFNEETGDELWRSKVDSIFIDVGASSKEDVDKMGIKVGTVVTFKDELMELGKDYYTGRALDNRIGGYMIAEVARKIKEKKKGTVRSRF